MASEAWDKQSKSLVQVQVFGTNLEKEVQKSLGWTTGRALYDVANGYDLEVDCVYPNVKNPETIVSVTYSNPDTPGHSNENKLQLKLGELALLKSAFPNIRIALAIGGTEKAWLVYVLQAFRHLYDEVLFLWRETDAKRLLALGKDPTLVKPKHEHFWKDLRISWAKRRLKFSTTPPPHGLVRYQILDILRGEAKVNHPSKIKNEIARACMQASYDIGGAEWANYQKGSWHGIEMSRNYFNPVEAATQITLDAASLKYEGGLARDVEVASLLHQLGMTHTKLFEDFVLASDTLKMPVYIQCKASGGGRRQHGKNIQNRAKEQVARGILYTASILQNGDLKWNDKGYHWVSVLDGDWGVNKGQPLKYVHMLQLAGYDALFCAQDLLCF